MRARRLATQLQATGEQHDKEITNMRPLLLIAAAILIASSRFVSAVEPNPTADPPGKALLLRVTPGRNGP